MDNEAGDSAIAVRRAEIDTRPPFKSVREAVLLFGERVLAGEIIANKLKEMRDGANESRQKAQTGIATLTAELEETKQSLIKAREENNRMAICIKSLKEELEWAKRELKQLRAGRDYSVMTTATTAFRKHPLDPEIEDVKFIENMTKVGKEKKIVHIEEDDCDDDDVANGDGFEFQTKKRYVKFASPPSLTRVIASRCEHESVERPPSMKKKNKKALISLVGWFFPKKKIGHDHEEDY